MGTAIRCPECQADAPASSIILLRSWRKRPWWKFWRPAGLESWVSGERMCCQMCGHVYSVGPHGTFKHSLLAHPILDPLPEQERDAREEQGPPGPVGPTPLPLPKRRPWGYGG